MQETPDNIEKPEELSEAEKEAWQKLGSELIYNSESVPELSPASAKEASEQIQEEYLQLFKDDQDRMHKIVTEGIAYREKMLGKIDGQENKPALNSEPAKQTSPDIFYHLIWEHTIGGQYYGWGFTPKLARNVDELRPNCLGVAILLGAYAKSQGDEIEMAITPDHPSVVVKRDGKRFMLGKEGDTEIKKDGIEEKNEYAIYRPKDSEQSDKMMIIADFDQAVLYETFENMAVLRNLSEQSEQYTLPSTKSEGEKIAAKHKEALQSADWKSIQNKLFPKLSKAFSDNKEEWEAEIARAKDLRKRQYLAKNILGIFKEVAAKKQTVEDTEAFWQSANEHLAKFNEEEKEDIVETIRKNFAKKAVDSK
ncbi:MAG: hypothetical protein V4438_03295 [Patescibacteria group bacterium]